MSNEQKPISKVELKNCRIAKCRPHAIKDIKEASSSTVIDLLNSKETRTLNKKLKNEYSK